MVAKPTQKEVQKGAARYPLGSMRSLIAVLLCCASTASTAAAAAPRDPVDEQVTAVAQALHRDRGSPRAAAHLAELKGLEPEAQDLSRLATACAGVAGDPQALPEVRAMARVQLAGIERARGNLQRQANHLRRLGYVTAWRVVGPFDDEGKRGFGSEQPPERAVDLEAVYPGKGGDAAWREVAPEVVDGGFVHVGAALPREQEVCAHALALVETSHDERVGLWFGGSGAARVRVNGAVAIEDPSYHPARPDQRGALVSLRRGVNRVQVKLCSQEGPMGFYLRLADARGGALAFAQPATLPLPAQPAAGARPIELPGLVARLEARVAAAVRRPGDAARRAEAEARVDLARVLTAVQPADPSERRALSEARLATGLAPAWAPARLLAASLEVDENQRREQLEAALAASPEEPRALFGLAREALARDRAQAAVRLLERAVRAAPGFGAARALLSEALERAGLEARAALVAGESAALLPRSPDAVRAAARAARRLGRLDEAAWLLRKAVSLRFDDGEARASLAQLLLDRGDVDDAFALLAEGLRVRPGQVDELLRLADLLAANGRGDDAEARYAEALRVSPSAAEPWARRGRARLRAGREADALADLHRALELEPQRRALKDLVRSLEPSRELFEAPYALDALALAKAPDDGAADDDAVILGELQVTRVLPTGLASTYYQEVVRVRTPRGAETWRRRSISYSPDRQDVEVVRVRIVKPDGTTVDTWDESEASESEPWYRLYYDTRSRSLSVSGLTAGDVLEVAWRVDDTARDNLLSDSFGDLTQIDGPTPKRRFDYVLVAPAARSLHANAPEGVRRTERPLPGGLVEHRWIAENVSRIEDEPMMPPGIEVGRFLHVSTFASWEEVGRFYWGLVRDQLQPTPEVRATAERLAAEALAGRRPAKAPSREETEALVRAVYGFVVTQVRYVGLEFGIHGYKPYRVDQVLQRRFGDCKDKASLMHALLEALGIDSRLVLLRMRRLGSLPEAPASLAAFNHAILYVPSLDLWLDGTAAYTGSHELPSEDRGASVLVVEPEGPSRFGRAPEAAPGENGVTTEYAVTLAADGSAAIDGHSLIAGAQAAQYRRAYEVSSSRRALLEQAFGRIWPAVRVVSVEPSPLSRLEQPVELRFRLSAPGFAQREGGALRFTPFGAQRGFSERWASLATRRYELVAGDPDESRSTYRIALPRGWEPAELPEPAVVDGPHASFELRYRAEPGAIVVEARITLKDRRIPVTDYPAFRALLAAADAAFDRPIRLLPAVRGPEAR
jgi:tetratricopeptide (TPR) repeat protein/transglutaminase-like putative cysteine protease